MEQNAQNGAFYPFNLQQHAFNSRSSEDPSPFLPPGYAAPSSATQGFHTMDSVQGLDYGKPHEERDTCNIVTVAASDSTTKTNADNFYQALDGVHKRLSQLENIVQGLECSIEGLKCAEKENQNENNDKLARLELLIKEVLTGVQHLNESQKLDGAMSQMRKLQVVDEKASVGEEMQIPSTERCWHPNESHFYLEPSDTSEQLTQRVPVRPLPPQYSEAPPPPQSQNYAAPHNILPPPPSMSEPGKHTTQHPYPQYSEAPPPPQSQNYAAPHNILPPPPSTSEPGKPTTQHPYAPLVPPNSGQPLPPHHSMQVPPFPYQAQAHASLPTPPPQGLHNQSGEATSYGHMQLHQQYTEPPRPLSNSYPEFPQYYGGGAHQEVTHSSPQYGSSGTHVYEPAAGMVGATPVFVPPYVQSRPQSSPPVSMYETTSGTGYNNGPPYRAAQPTSGGGGSHSRLPKAQPLHSALPASNGMPVGSASPSRNQINEVTERVVAMGFSREQVRAVVQGLTDIGQPVDMNAVLDKLMNRGESPQPQRGWYNRG